MAEQKGLSDDQLRRHIVAKMWLNYYNNTLLEQGIITESQHKKMQAKIAARNPSAALGRTD